MKRSIAVDDRVRRAFNVALQRIDDIAFSREDIAICDKKKMGDPIVCSISAKKRNGGSAQASGLAFVYSDMIVVCIENILKAQRDRVYPNHYEYLSF